MTMKKIIILMLIIAAAGAGHAFGQSSIAETGLDGSNSIIRYWKSGKSIVCTQNSSGTNYFLLTEQSSGMVRRIAVPAYAMVNDFCILHDTVFAGGYLNAGGTRQALLACFDANDFYNSGGNLHFSGMTPTPLGDNSCGGCTLQISEVSRLALYDTNGSTQIAYLAKSSIAGELIERIGIGKAVFDGTSWSNILIYNKYAIEEYSDIIATRSHVAAVGQSNDSARLVMRLFPKQDFLIPTWDPSGYWYYYNKFGQGMKDLTIYSNVVATALDNDDFAVAYHYYGPSDKGLALKTFSINASLASLTQAINMMATKTPSPNWEMQEMRYSPALHRIALLTNYDEKLAADENIIYQFPSSGLAAGTYYGRYLGGNKLFSMDCNIANPHSYVSSGVTASSNDIIVFEDAFAGSASCGTTASINAEAASGILYSTFMQTNTHYPNLYSGTMTFATDAIAKDIICSTK